MREREWEAAQSVWFWRDGSPGDAVCVRAATARSTARVLLALALASLLVRGGERIALFGERDAPAIRARRYRRIAHALGERPPADDAAAAGCAHRRATRNSSGSAIFWRPSTMSKSRIRELTRADAGGHLVHIVDPAEEDFPYRGPHALRGGEGRAEPNRSAAPKPWRAPIARASRRIAKRCASLARKLGWNYLAHRTDRSPQTALIALYADLGGGHKARFERNRRHELLADLSFGAPWILAGARGAAGDLVAAARDAAAAAARRVSAAAPAARACATRKRRRRARRWWLLLLRLLAAALLIVALAEPMIGQRAEGCGQRTPRAVHRQWLDGGAGLGCAQAAIWPKRCGSARAPIAPRRRHRRRPPDLPDMSLMDAGDAARAARALAPSRGCRSQRALRRRWPKRNSPQRPQILWLSDGIDDGNAHEAAELLSHLGQLRIFTDAPGQARWRCRRRRTRRTDWRRNLLRAGASGARSGDGHRATAHMARRSAAADFHFADGKNKTTARIALPLEMRNETTRLAIAGENSAGAVQLLGSRRAAARRRHCLGQQYGSEAAAALRPLLSGARAVALCRPAAKARSPTLLSRRDVSVLILADIGKIAGADHDRVAKFVDGGGLLIRFAGERMTAARDDLVPVKLRSGGRYLGGALAWAAPQHLAPFPDASPFGGLTIPSDVTVSRQILAEPSVELADPHLGAADRRHAAGHGGASRQGLDRAVSCDRRARPGRRCRCRDFMSICCGGCWRCRRERPGEMTAQHASLPAVMTLDGFGQLARRRAEALPIRAALIGMTEPSRRHPPGLYGAPGAERALNAAAVTTRCSCRSARIRTCRATFYSARGALALEPSLLAARDGAAAARLRAVAVAARLCAAREELCTRRRGRASRPCPAAYAVRRAPTMPLT